MRAVLIGCGNHGGDVLLPAALSAGIQLVGLVDRDPVRAQALAQQWGIAYTFSSTDELGRSRLAPNAAIIALPVSEQGHHVEWALSAGLHVFVEKPPAADPAQLRALAEQAHASGLVCCVGMNFRCADAVRALVDHIDSGRHGVACYVRVVQVAHKPIAPFGADQSVEASLFHAQGIHAIDLALLLAPSMSAINGQFVRVNRGRLCVVVGEDPLTGSRVEATFGSCAAGLYHQVDVFLDTGDLLSLHNLSELHYLPNGGEYGVKQYPGSRVLWRRSPVGAGYTSAGYATELADFAARVADGPTRPDNRLADLSELLPVYDVFDKMLASSGVTWTA